MNRGTDIHSRGAQVSNCELFFRQSQLAPVPLTARLQKYIDLSGEEIEDLEHLCQHRRTIAANTTLIHEDARLAVVYVVLTGVAFRYKLLANGRRQIFGYLMPGEMCDPEFAISNRCDHNVCILSDADVAVIPISELNSFVARRPRIWRALMLSHQRDGSVLRDWLLNMGQRHALQRIAYFLSEMTEQLYPEGQHSAGSLPMPLTQHELADTVGLTVVHVNRCLQQLRDDGVIAWGRKRVTILDRDRLMQISCSERPRASLEDLFPSPSRWLPQVAVN